MTQQTTLADMRTPVPAPVVQAGFFNAQGFELMQRVSKAFASSTLVPTAYQNNVANCMIALNLANRLKADELMVMQNLYIVHGNPGWSSKFLIASVNTCGRFSALRYEWRGVKGSDDYGCRAWAIEKETGERLDGAWIDWTMVKAEGWANKNGSKWKTMPDQMFIYRAAAFWQRAYAPEISMGMNSAEELQDVIDVNSDGTYTVTQEELRTSNMKTVEPETVDQDTGEIVQEQPAAQPSAPQPQTTGPSITYAQVADKLVNAADVDVLDANADLIREIEDAAQQAELNAMYQKRRDELLNPPAAKTTKKTAAPINAE